MLLGYIATVLIGVLVGVIASVLAPGARRDVVLDALLGISGGLVGSRIAQILFVPGPLPHVHQIAAAIGAVIFLCGWRIACQHRRF
jgi:uncharacterized membrane protein YeaQ/YmgE (transglycosylase-associated protein family)